MKGRNEYRERHEDQLAEAVRAAKNHEEEGFALLYQMTRAKTLSVIRRTCKERGEWEDVLQETYIQVFRFIGDLKDERKVQAWINRIAANLSVRNNMEKRPLPILGTAQMREGPVQEDPAETFFKREMIRLTIGILKELPQKQRAALWMVYGMKLSIREAAFKLKVPENTVKSRLFRGRQRLLERSQAFEQMGFHPTSAALSSLIALAFACRELFEEDMNQYL